jgi:hypothetical protein
MGTNDAAQATDLPVPPIFVRYRKITRATFRPRLESLERRLTPTTYTVSSLADSGDGSLRAAITSANGDSTPDEIDFSVAGVIKLTSDSLPTITNTVKIDGTTAPGFAGAPVVEIDCNGALGLTLTGSSSILSSLSIVHAGGAGVTLRGTVTELSRTGSGMTIVGNYIGLALDGSVAPNSTAGLFIDDSLGDTIGGTTPADRNVISGNGSYGIQPGFARTGTFVQEATIIGNYIGTDITGQAAAPNQDNGIIVFSSQSAGEANVPNTIGGTAAGAGNIIAFNGASGVVLPGNGLTVVVGNSIFNNQNLGIGVLDGASNWAVLQLGYAVESPGVPSGSTQVQVGGTVNGAPPNLSFTVQVYATLSGVPAGQGQIFLGSVQATSNASGFATFTLRNAAVPAGAGTTFTATATFSGTSVLSSPIGVSTPNQAYVANIYQLLLSRIPDPSSATWVNALNNGASPASVVLAIEGSPEYLNDQVVALYRHYLQRNPDMGGQQAWTNSLLAGGTLEQVAEALVSSQEYFILQGGTNQGYITGLYRDVLDRALSAAELAGWEAALDSGVSRASVAVAFLTSQEYRTELVQIDYLTYLLRPADQGGLTNWVNALNAGATDQQVLAQIFGAPEGYQLWS